MIYSSPTNKRFPSSTLIDNMSATVRPLYMTSSVDALYRVPWQSGHSVHAEGRKRSSIITDSSPSQVGQCPPVTLKENRPGLYPRKRASGVSANRRRTWSNRSGVGGNVRPRCPTDANQPIRMPYHSHGVFDDEQAVPSPPLSPSRIPRSAATSCGCSPADGSSRM